MRSIDRRGFLALGAVIVVVVAAAGLALAGPRAVTPAASGGPSAVAYPSRPSLPPPWTSPDPAIAYDAVFDGDATGATDVSKELSRFLAGHDGQRVALAIDGVYRVTQVAFTAKDLTVDFRGAVLRGTQQGVHGIFVMRSGSKVVFNDPSIEGTGYAWNGGDSNPDQWEHGIEIDGGSDVTINNPKTRNVRGDGIYVGFEEGQSNPPTAVVINNPDIEHSSRNGIAPVAGDVSIFGGHIYDTGLHGVDFEPNNDVGARSIVGIVDGVDLRRFGDLDVAGLTGYAVATASAATSVKRPSILVENVTGDELRMTIWDTAVATIRDNVSDNRAVADFPGTDSVTFTNNLRISRH